MAKEYIEREMAIETLYYKDDTMNILKIIFPALMVIGALGSLVVNLIGRGHYAISIQWVGAALLYTALMIRNWG